MPRGLTTWFSCGGRKPSAAAVAVKSSFPLRASSMDLVLTKSAGSNLGVFPYDYRVYCILVNIQGKDLRTIRGGESLLHWFGSSDSCWKHKY